jgi:hypothetical protein
MVKGKMDLPEDGFFHLIAGNDDMLYGFVNLDDIHIAEIISQDIEICESLGIEVSREKSITSLYAIFFEEY